MIDVPCLSARPVPIPDPKHLLVENDAETREHKRKTLPTDETEATPNPPLEPIPEPQPEPFASIVEFLITTQPIDETPPPLAAPDPMPVPSNKLDASIFDLSTDTLPILTSQPEAVPVPIPVSPTLVMQVFTKLSDVQCRLALTPIPGAQYPPSATIRPAPSELIVTFELPHSNAE
jgi:hypothetical protein